MKEYFSHDYNATLDPKIIALLGDYGAIGYGIYWRTIELLFSTHNRMLKLNNEVFLSISENMKVDVEKVGKIIYDCILTYELFKVEDNYFYSIYIKPKLGSCTSKRMHNYNVKKWYRIIKQVFKRDNYTCQYCGSVGGKLEADHIVPFSKGGSDSMDNLTTSCRRCNRQKKDKSVEEFKIWRECHGTTN